MFFSAKLSNIKNRIIIIIIITEGARGGKQPCPCLTLFYFGLYGLRKTAKILSQNVDLRTKIKWRSIRLFNNSVSILSVIWIININGRKKLFGYNFSRIWIKCLDIGLEILINFTKRLSCRPIEKINLSPLNITAEHFRCKILPSKSERQWKGTSYLALAWFLGRKRKGRTIDRIADIRVQIRTRDPLSIKGINRSIYRSKWQRNDFV
jgi:hypothetical protein